MKHLSFVSPTLEKKVIKGKNFLNELESSVPGILLFDLIKSNYPLSEKYRKWILLNKLLRVDYLQRLCGLLNSAIIVDSEKLFFQRFFQIWLFTCFSLLLFAPAANATVDKNASRANILYILDASGSMWGRVEDQEKILVARDVLIDLIQQLPQNINVGLEVYGHRRKGDCDDIEIMVPVGGGDRKALIQQIQSIQPKGKTPLAGSIQLAGEALKSAEDKTTIVLVSDGNETCGGDPCERTRTLIARGINVQLHVVGFDVKGDEAEQLMCIAKAGNGRYFTAKNASELSRVLMEIKQEVVEMKPEIKSPPEVKIPKKKKKSLKLLPMLGYINISNLTVREVAVCSPTSNCYNSSNDGWAGVISPVKNSLQLPAGTYKLKFDNHYLEAVEVRGGETTEVQLGALSIPNLNSREIAVCAPASNCYNTSNNGWAGVISPVKNSLQLPTGTYKLKFDNHYLEAVEVRGGETTEVQLGALSIPYLNSREVAVCSPTSNCYNSSNDGWAGVISPVKNSLQLPTGTYKLKFDNHYLEAVEVRGSETTEVQLGALSIPNLNSREISVCSPTSNCYNSSNDGWAGVISPVKNSLQLPTGTYKLKFDNHYLEAVEVRGSETTEVQLGALSIPNLNSREVAVCAPASNCYNSSNDGWAGKISPASPTLELPSGTYKLKFENQYLENVTVEAGQELVIE